MVWNQDAEVDADRLDEPRELRPRRIRVPGIDVIRPSKLSMALAIGAGRRPKFATHQPITKSMYFLPRASR